MKKCSLPIKPAPRKNRIVVALTALTALLVIGFCAGVYVRRARAGREAAVAAAEPKGPQSEQVAAAPPPPRAPTLLEAESAAAPAPAPVAGPPAEPPPVSEYYNPAGNVKITVHQPPTKRVVEHPKYGKVVEIKYSDGETLYEPADEVMMAAEGKPMRSQPVPQGAF